VRKADDSLLFPQATWRRTFDSLVNQLRKCLVAVSGVDALNYTQSLKMFIRSCKLSDLNKDAIQIERNALSLDPRPDNVLFLLSAFQLKKLNEGDEDETEVSFLADFVYFFLNFYFFFAFDSFCLGRVFSWTLSTLSIALPALKNHDRLLLQPVFKARLSDTHVSADRN
jgi:hypothetical protein